MAKLSEADPETQAAAGLGHNRVLDQEAFEKHVSAILRQRNGPIALAEAALKAAKKVEKDLKADAKKDGIKLTELEIYLRLRALDDEGQAVENASALAQYLKWGELLPGTQGDLFTGLTPTPMEAEERWYKRGYKDIREGAIDPEGYFNEKTGKREPGPIMPADCPSYVPAEFYPAWAKGAYEADDLNNADFLAKQEGRKIEPDDSDDGADAGAEIDKEFADA